MVVLFTKNNCPNCKKTKRLLKVSGIEYKEKNVESDESAFDFVKNTLGYTSLPVLAVEANNVEDSDNSYTYHNSYKEILEKVKELKSK